MYKILLKLVYFFVIELAQSQSYKIGAGIADCTGPPAKITFLGYGRFDQKGCGLHLRQYSRAFIFDDGSQSAVFVSVDVAMLGYGVTKAVFDNLRRLFKSKYTENNVVLSATHTHSTPGGFMMDFLYDIPMLGFVNKTFFALVDGITKSIARAHNNLADGTIFVSSGELLGVNINRSPYAYLQNPLNERSKYQYNVDKDMIQLKLVQNGTLIGAINWYAIHATSMNSSNCYISSDNLGYASILLENDLNQRTTIPLAKRKFVGAFASSNQGDVSPNTNGPFCPTIDLKCDLATSLCIGNKKKIEYCVSSGPGEDMFESTKIIAEKLFGQAKSLLVDSQSFEVTGPVKSIQKYVDMSKEEEVYLLPNGTKQQVKGCQPAMGYSFGAGTTDGPGYWGFSQNTYYPSFFWNSLRNIIFNVSKENTACQKPKPILISGAEARWPFEWEPSIVSTQLIQIGQVVIIPVPGEFTTMSGRRLKNALGRVFLEAGSKDNLTMIVAGLSNTYASYVATPEEYQVQRYEGASTLFGPHTLTIYLKLYEQLADALLKNEEVPQNSTIPVNLESKVIRNFFPRYGYGSCKFRSTFGKILVKPPDVVLRNTTLSVVINTCHLFDNAMREKTFFTIDFLENGTTWTVVATDADFDTKLHWLRNTQIKILWDIPSDATEGDYRIRHFGKYRSRRRLRPYEVKTNVFKVV